LGDLNGTRKCFDFCYENNYTSASCQSNYCKCLTFVPKDKPRLPASDETLSQSDKPVLPVMILGQSYQRVFAAGKVMTVFTPPKVGSPPLEKEKSISVSEKCSEQGFLTSYPQPGSLGDRFGTRKCFEYCYSLSYDAAICLEHSCTCIAMANVSQDTISRSYKKVTAAGKDMAVFTPPKRGTPNLKRGKGVSVSARCSDQGFLTSYPQPGTLGDLNGTRKCYDYCYSHSFKGAVCQKHYCKCLAYSPAIMPTVTEDKEHL
jgi:hypothetical protein